MKKILVIGAGASGMMAAIWAAKGGSDVTIYEKNDRVGKKILATGNGKCNLTNLYMGVEHYYTEAPERLKHFLEVFSAGNTISFFEEYGLMTRDRDGYVYPYCEQAAVVLDVLRNAMEQEHIKIKTSVTDIAIETDSKDSFIVTSSVGTQKFDALILACGSKAGIKNGDELGYEYAGLFGHRIHKLYPALVQVRCQEKFFSMVAGVRCKAKITLFADKKRIAQEQGEVQLTDYGISGIPVFQISRLIAGYLDEKKKILVSMDFLPHLTADEWREFYQARIVSYQGRSAEEFLLGILHKKISLLLLKQYDIKPSEILSGKNNKDLVRVCESMKQFMVTPVAVNSFEQAQVCRGGVDLSQLDDNLQSIFQKNLYICGEMLDVDGKCGGYNLQWAWTSGYIAGRSATGLQI